MPIYKFMFVIQERSVSKNLGLKSEVIKYPESIEEKIVLEKVAA